MITSDYKWSSVTLFFSVFLWKKSKKKLKKRTKKYKKVQKVEKSEYLKSKRMKKACLTLNEFILIKSWGWCNEIQCLFVDSLTHSCVMHRFFLKTNYFRYQNRVETSFVDHKKNVTFDYVTRGVANRVT